MNFLKMRQPTIAENNEPSAKTIDDNINLVKSKDKKCIVYITCANIKNLIRQVKEWLKTLDTIYDKIVSEISVQLVKKQEDVKTDAKIKEFITLCKTLETQMNDASVKRTMKQKNGHIIKDEPKVKVSYTDGKDAHGHIFNIKLDKKLVVSIRILKTDGKYEIVVIDLESLCIVEDCDIAIETDKAAQARATEKAIKTQLAIEVQNGGKLFKKHKKNRDGDNNIFVCE
jgi:hypothetical protein